MLNGKYLRRGMGWWLCGTNDSSQRKENKNYLPYELMIDYTQGGKNAVQDALQEQGFDLDYKVPQ